MPISIKNPDTEQLARELAALTNTSLTETIHEAVADRLARLKRERSGRAMAEELMEIGARCSRLPVISDMSADEVLGYDEFGIPSR